MRSIKGGAIAVMLAAAIMAGASPAHAEEPAPGAPAEVIWIDLNLLGCSFGAGLGGDVLLALTAGNGSSAGISSGLATRLRLAGCLPWTR
ncbi:hypothetical protein OHA40_13640 [Nocardia sp. NBC_00508]|uniref:hypothetical protein n=1 Tax=Nocardia sp. NBC_00508 TaxID=2975992 RepID=UPI002E7FF8C9|nr:hypothetical protein [Nocardia sp. NBC_00508]WUD69071.1 hypothetical protein OHA40_13640 [Nocardia sp. NBC_00508]